MTACASATGVSRIALSPPEIVAAAGGIYKIGEPYTILGQRFIPQENPTYDKTGIASWYAEEFHGKRTANGEHYDMYLFTAAHPTLPMPSWVEVTNLRNGRKLTVRVNDRGPFKKNREIDLSLAAAQELGLFQSGNAMVRVRYLGRAPIYSVRGRLLDGGDAIPSSSLDAFEESRLRARRDSNTSRYAPPRIETADPYAIVRNRGWIVQIGTYKRQASARQLAAQYGDVAPWQISAAPRGNMMVYRVHSPLLSSADAAQELRSRLADAGHIDALILQPR